MSALARWCLRHPLTVVGICLAVLIGFGVLSMVQGSAYEDAFALPDTESSQATALPQEALPEQSDDSSQIVVQVDSGSLSDLELSSSGLPRCWTRWPSCRPSSRSPTLYSERGAGQISEDGRTAYATMLSRLSPRILTSRRPKPSSRRPLPSRATAWPWGWAVRPSS